MLRVLNAVVGTIDHRLIYNILLLFIRQVRLCASIRYTYLGAFYRGCHDIGTWSVLWRSRVDICGGGLLRSKVGGDSSPCTSLAVRGRTRSICQRRRRETMGISTRRRMGRKSRLLETWSHNPRSRMPRIPNKNRKGVRDLRHFYDNLGGFFFMTAAP